MFASPSICNAAGDGAEICETDSVDRSIGMTNRRVEVLFWRLPLEGALLKVLSGQVSLLPLRATECCRYQNRLNCCRIERAARKAIGVLLLQSFLKPFTAHPRLSMPIRSAASPKARSLFAQWLSKLSSLNFRVLKRILSCLFRSNNRTLRRFCYLDCSSLLGFQLEGFGWFFCL